MNFAILTGFSDMPYPAPGQFSESTEHKDLLAATLLYDHYLNHAHIVFKQRIESAKVFNPALAVEQQIELKALRLKVTEQDRAISSLQRTNERLSEGLAYHKKISLGRLNRIRDLSKADGESRLIGMKISDVLESPIEELHLSVRSGNCLRSAGIYSIGQLIHCKESELLKVPNLGRHSMNEISEVLAGIGLVLGPALHPDEIES